MQGGTMDSNNNLEELQNLMRRDLENSGLLAQIGDIHALLQEAESRKGEITEGGTDEEKLTVAFIMALADREGIDTSGRQRIAEELGKLGATPYSEVDSSAPEAAE